MSATTTDVEVTIRLTRREADKLLDDLGWQSSRYGDPSLISARIKLTTAIDAASRP